MFWVFIIFFVWWSIHAALIALSVVANDELSGEEKVVAIFFTPFIAVISVGVEMGIVGLFLAVLGVLLLVGLAIFT